MEFGFHPVPKHKPNRSKSKGKQKGVSYHKGLKIPHRKQRGKIKRQDYNEALRVWGECCTECGNPKIEMHHVVYRSHSGRGGYRNLRPLCKVHHDQAHKERGFTEELKKQHKRKYGKHFYKDRFDLWKEGVLENPSQELFDEFMKGEEKRCRKNGLKNNG